MGGGGYDGVKRLKKEGEEKKTEQKKISNRSELPVPLQGKRGDQDMGGHRILLPASPPPPSQASEGKWSNGMAPWPTRYCGG